MATQMQFHPQMQAAINAGVLTPHQVWALGWQWMFNPTGQWPAEAQMSLDRLKLFLDSSPDALPIQ